MQNFLNDGFHALLHLVDVLIGLVEFFPFSVVECDAKFGRKGWDYVEIKNSKVQDDNSTVGKSLCRDLLVSL